ncbi:twin-arginine translocation pathway signal protein [Novosphingobium cyanobacteriorum]|uniref:Twin-arginine translocation pathway signal protein n=1 Tax=Novosphingobium cyanobacteriorum TaxID=3024215 RepID=A0ABT6CFK1_9SPHN|nr:twin-arginine translocation pathway signal protein [Novosphingobium cyanobacteriorum]MDF8332696.1 twin-arginine translocation pathway signal protein [Novosphingobium cyanobacteriorum]
MKVGLLMLAMAFASLEAVPAQAETATTVRVPFVTAEFAAPTSAQGQGFRLEPLGPKLVRIDFAAYMSSIEHLQQTFTRSTAWPHAGITDAEAMVDMETEQRRFLNRESFAYAVLTPDGRRERGCVYVSPSPVPGHDAVVRLWVTKAEYDAGFDAELYAWVQDWLRRDWPFKAVAYPGRAIPWAQWDAMTAGKPGA